MSPSYVETFEASHLGMDTESAPHRLAKGYARDVLNMLTGKPGRLPVRGGLNLVSTQLWAAAGNSAAWVASSGIHLYGRVGDTTLVKLSNDWSKTTFAVTADQIPAGPYVRVGGNVFGISTTGKFLWWTGGASVTTYVNAPTLGVDMAVWNNRIWYLAGTGADGVAGHPNTLYWSDLVGTDALPDTLVAWKDDVSGLINKLEIASLLAAVPVGLGAVPNALVVFGPRSAAVLVGSSPSNLVVRDNAVAHGCVDRRAILSHSGGIIWAAPEGVFYFDGAQEIELSASIRGSLQAAIASSTGVQIVQLPNDYVLVQITQAATTLLYMLHVPTRSWSRMSVAAVPRTLIQVDAGYTPDGVTLETMTAAYFDGQRTWRLDEATRPRSTQRTGSDVTAAAGQQVFLASVDSRLSMLASPSTVAVVRRLSATSICEKSSGTPASTDGWTVKLRDTADNSLLASSQLTIVTSGLANMQALKHDVFEAINDEANAVYATAQFSGSAAATLASGEIQDMAIEYDTAQKPASF